MRFFSRSENFDLTNVSIATRLLVLEDSNLNVHSFASGAIAVVEWEDVPTEGLNELNHFDLLQLVEAVRNANGELLRCVTLIGLEIEV